MAERHLQSCLHGLRLLVGAGRKPNGEARMIVDDGQRMQPRATTQSHLPLDVHLPQRVRLTALECPIGAAGAFRCDAAMTRQHRMHGRGRWRSDPVAQQDCHDLARAPGRMRVAHRKDLCFETLR